MDPLVQLFTTHGMWGVGLFVLWKIAIKLIGAWKEIQLARFEHEKGERVEHREERKEFSEAIRENTRSNHSLAEFVRDLAQEFHRFFHLDHGAGSHKTRE